LSIVRISKNQKTQRFGNWICFRLQARGWAPTLQENQKLAFPQAMPEQKKVNHWKQGDYKHLTAGRVQFPKRCVFWFLEIRTIMNSSCCQVLIVLLFPVVDLLLFWHRL
jgi:hypothetical protein